MMAQKKDFNKDVNILLYITFSVLLLLLSIFNLQNIKVKTKQVTVLGTNTNIDYWNDFVVKHPTYIEGWNELNRQDKVKEIDPNYFN